MVNRWHKMRPNKHDESALAVFVALRYLELIGSLPTSSFFYTISIFERAKRTLHFLLVHCPDQRIENRSLCNVPYR